MRPGVRLQSPDADPLLDRSGRGVQIARCLSCRFRQSESGRPSLWRANADTLITFKGGKETGRSVATPIRNRWPRFSTRPSEGRALMLTTLGLAFLAGLLSILSPCILPILPIVMATAASRHRAGPVAMASGVVTSFVAIGLFVATVGFSIGLDGDVCPGACCWVHDYDWGSSDRPAPAAAVCGRGGSLGGYVDRNISAFDNNGLAGQFAVGCSLEPSGAPVPDRRLGQRRSLPRRAISWDGCPHDAVVRYRCGLSVDRSGPRLPSNAHEMAQQAIERGTTPRLPLGLHFACLERPS